MQEIPATEICNWIYAVYPMYIIANSYSYESTLLSSLISTHSPKGIWEVLLH